MLSHVPAAPLHACAGHACVCRGYTVASLFDSMNVCCPVTHYTQVSWHQHRLLAEVSHLILQAFEVKGCKDTWGSQKGDLLKTLSGSLPNQPYSFPNHLPNQADILEYAVMYRARAHCQIRQMWSMRPLLVTNLLSKVCKHGHQLKHMSTGSY